MCAMMRCTSSGCTGPGDNFSFPAGLGVGKGGTKLSHGLGRAVPGNARGLVVGVAAR